MGVPVAFVTTYAATLDQMSRAVQQQVRAEGVERRILDRSIQILQGRLEGIALAWYEMDGGRARSDDKLRSAVYSWRVEQHE